MKIRIAAAEDIPEIEELYRQLFAAVAEIQPEFIRPVQDESFIRAKKISYRLGGRENGWLSKVCRLMSASFRIVLPVSWIWQRKAPYIGPVCSGRRVPGP
ncbi:MAG: hypothetical protein ACLUOI_04960 [Eisenbergiella sp.]